MEEVKQIMNIGGIDRPLSFGQMTADLYPKYLRVSNGVVIPASSIYSAIYSAIYTGAYINDPGKPIDFTFADVTMWVDDLYNDGRHDDIKRVCDDFGRSKSYKNLLKFTTEVSAKGKDSKKQL